MISKDKVIEIFCIADDFCREFEKEVAKKHFQIMIVHKKDDASV